MSTDPYGSLEFAIGTKDDFWCFDYHINGDNVTLHAVINSETGGFIMNAEEPVTVPKEEAVEVAQHYVDNALDWLFEAGDPLEHDTEGWNQDPQYFVRAVKNAILHSTYEVLQRIVEEGIP